MLEQPGIQIPAAAKPNMTRRLIASFILGFPRQNVLPCYNIKLFAQSALGLSKINSNQFRAPEVSGHLAYRKLQELPAGHGWVYFYRQFLGNQGFSESTP
jgi:hypothetical protein